MISVVLMMHLVVVQGPTWPASAGPSPYGPEVAPTYPGAPTEAAPLDVNASRPAQTDRRRRFVFGFLPSLTFGVSPIPSVGPAFFVGGRLPRGPWALGYQLTLSGGLADRYSSGLLAHRHHVTAMRAFGRAGRGFASVGGGAAFLVVVPVVEAEGRVGLRFGSKRYGVVAAQVRLGWNLGRHEQAPMPQLGVVFGLALL